MGGILSRLLGLFSGDDFVGNVAPIHGRPYLFQRCLGRGGFGAVYAARNPDGVPVAVKVINLYGLPPGRAASIASVYLNEVEHLERLQRETRHVVHIYDFDFDPSTGLGYIVMELGGENLSALIRNSHSRTGRHGPAVDLMMVKRFWHQMVSIARTLHANNIVHMDLKPDNFILFGQTLKIADLGTSKKSDALGVSRMGTPYFSAPEIMEDAPGLHRFYGPKADIWSLGATLYFMIYGVPPRYHPSPASPPPGLPRHPDPALNDLLRRTLVRNPNARADLATLMYHPFSRM